MENRNAFITGGSTGIGKSICIAVAKRGYNVIFSHFDKTDEKALQTVDEIHEFGFDVEYIKADSSKKGDRLMMLNYVVSKFNRLDLLVNNAGISPPKRADILEATEESFDLVLAVNLKGPYFITQRLALHMIDGLKKYQDYNPVIINISSISAYTSSTNRGDYCISKAGVSMMTKLFADRLSEFGISVFEIQPGIIMTDMTASVKDKYDDLILNKNILLQKRWGFPEDVARVVDSIVSDSFTYSTGQVFNVDGGFKIRRL